MNDITRPGLFFDSALADLDLLHERLAESGATVVTTTFPDIGQIVPVGRFLSSRVKRTNAAIAAAADRHGFRLVDLFNAPSMTRPDTWSDDRVHGSTKGHMLFAAAAAEALNLPSSNHDWAQAGSVAWAVPAITRLFAIAVDEEHAHPVAMAPCPRQIQWRRQAAETPEARKPCRLETEESQRNRRFARSDRLHHPRAEERYGESGEKVRAPERHAGGVGDLRRDIGGILSRIGQHRADGLADRDHVGRIGRAAQSRVGHRVEKRVTGRVGLCRRGQQRGFRR